MSHALLVASLVLLTSGPALARLARGRPATLAFIDGFVLVSIGGLVLLDVIPHALERGDVLALVVMVAGFALPGLAERLLRYGVRQTHLVVMALAMLGVALHSAFDGSALAQSALAAEFGSTRLLGLGVLLHQLPVSLMVWWVLSDRHPAVPWLVLAGMGATTVLGYVAEPTVFAALPERASGLFEALVGGSLLHVIAHPAHDHDPAHEHEPGHPHRAEAQAHDHAHDHDHAHAHDHAHEHKHEHAHASELPARSGRASGVGALLGGALLLLLLYTRREAHGALALDATLGTLRTLMLDSAPAILLAYIAAGFVATFVPVAGLRWMSRGSRPRQALAGMAVGLPLPICSCGVVPLYRQLVQQGASTTAAVAFLVATPELGIDAVLLSVPLLGAPFAVVRVVAAALAAVVLALVLGRLVRRAGRALPLLADQRRPATTAARLRNVARVGFGEMVDHTAPWILVGLVVAAVCAPLLERSWLTQLPAGVDVVVFAAVGLPLYICASASTPLVAVLIAAGVSPGAGLALLLTGPASNLSTIGVLTRMHGRRFALTFSALMIGVAVLLGWGVNLAFPDLASAQPPIETEAVGTTLQWIALGATGLLFAASVVRRGARGFLGELRATEA
ncbi:MAG: permease [Gemmatimonadetes bacterium]|nr:permease [Gemmatimonadota bacterium]